MMWYQSTHQSLYVAVELSRVLEDNKGRSICLRAFTAGTDDWAIWFHRCLVFLAGRRTLLEGKVAFKDMLRVATCVHSVSAFGVYVFSVSTRGSWCTGQDSRQ